MSPPNSFSAINLTRINKWFDQRRGDRLHVVRDIDLDVPAKSILAILGASGCGKSTLLNIIAGLVTPDSGTVTLNGQPQETFDDWRSLTYMFQEDRLLPWRTAAQNVAFGLEAGAMASRERNARVADVLQLVRLGDFASAYPHELSGGMRSRVALARSLVTEPSIILMDEPFSKLDPTTRTQLHGEVLRIAKAAATTLVIVTHDVEEAVTLADRVVVMHPRPGRIYESRSITLPYPRDPLSRDMTEEVRSLRVALAAAPERVDA
jgi:NitT/TauT family transport system ATP-binding protein